MVNGMWVLQVSSWRPSHKVLWVIPGEAPLRKI